MQTHKFHPQTKKKLEVLFRAKFDIDRVTDAAIKAFLEESIAGLRVKSLETYEAKGGTKAVVSSNLLEILLDPERRPPASVAKLVSTVIGHYSPNNPTLLEQTPGGEDEDKENDPRRMNRLARAEVAEAVKTELEKLKRELSESQAKLLVCDKKGKASEEILELFKVQVASMSKQIEELDNEKSKLDKQNKLMLGQLQELKQQLAVRNEAKALLKSVKMQDEYLINSQTELLESLLVQKQQAFDQERKDFENRFADMSMRILSAHERGDSLEKKAVLAEKLGKEVNLLRKELDGLRQAVQAGESTISSLRANELAAAEIAKKLAAEFADSQSKLGAAEQRIKDLVTESGDLTVKLEATKVECKELRGKLESLAGKTSLLEGEKAGLLELNAQLETEVSKQRTTGEKGTAERDSARQEAAELKRAVKEKSEEMIAVKVQLKESECNVKEIEADSKGKDSQIQELKAKINDDAEKLESWAKQSAELKHRLGLLELEVKHREKDVKAKEQQCENLKAELAKLRDRVDEAEKALLGAKAEQESQNKVRLDIPPETLETSVYYRGGLEVARLQKELDEAKFRVATLNGRVLELQDEAKKLRSDLAARETELLDANKRLDLYLSRGITPESFEGQKATLEAVRAENEKLAQTAEKFETLKGKHDKLLQECAEMKQALFDTETKTRSDTSAAPSESGSKVVEEIRGLINEIMYAYQTLDTNMKDLGFFYQTKKERAGEMAALAKRFGEAPGKIELSDVQKIAGDFAFLRAIPMKKNNLPAMVDCVREAAKKKTERVGFYDNQIARADSFHKISTEKIKAFEERLALYSSSSMVSS